MMPFHLLVYNLKRKMSRLLRELVELFLDLNSASKGDCNLRYKHW